MKIHLALVSVVLIGAGCEPTGGSCDELHARVSECFGAAAARPDVSCDADGAEDLLALSCEELGGLDAKDDGLLCAVFGLFCPVEPLFQVPAGEPTRHPIVLVHGFNASPENEWGVNPRIVRALEADGHDVHVARTSPFKPVAVRARELADEIERARARFGAERVNLIAHSMGGLDSRFAASRLGARVASVTTISSPHRGSRIADVILGLTPQPAGPALNAFATLFARTFTTGDLAVDSDLRGALESLSEAGAAAFNRETPDVAGVVYQSWAGISNIRRVANPADFAACAGGEIVFRDGARDAMDIRLVAIAPIVAHGAHLLPNDGMTTVASARWGRFRGCFPADHYDEVGQVNDTAPDPRSGFDAVRFYRALAWDLAAQGL